MNRVMTAAAIASTTVCLVVSGVTPAAAAARADAPRPRMAQERAIDRPAEIARILSTLDRGIDDPGARRRAVDKLGKLHDRQLRLIASLAERLAADGDGPAAAIALVLITALLLVS